MIDTILSYAKKANLFSHNFFIIKYLRENPPSESRMFSKNSIFQKADILVALNVLFQNMYKAYMNGAYLTQFWRDYFKSQ